MKFRSLNVTLTVAFLALTITILFTISAIYLYFNFQGQHNIVVNQQQFIALQATNEVKSFIQEKFSILKTASSLSNLITSKEEEQKIVLEELIGLESAFRQLVLLNAQKQELARISRLSSLVSSKKTEHIEDELFSHVSQGEEYISPIYIDEITSEPMVVIAVPVTDVFNDFKGILMAELNLKFMWDLMSNIKVGNNGLAYVVDNKGYLIAFSDISRVLARENLAYLREVSEFLNGSDEIIAERSIGIQGTNVVSTSISLGIPDWAVVIELPVKEAYHSVTVALQIFSLILILLIGLTILVSIYLSNRITRPIKKITKAIEDISLGKMGVQVEGKDRNDEIGALARAFDRTFVSLKLAMRMTVPELKKESDELKNALEEKEKTEEALKESEEKYRDLVENMIDVIYTLDMEGNITSVNKAIETTLGFEASEVIGKNFTKLIPKKVLPDTINVFKKILKGNKVTAETILVDKNGKQHNVEFSSTPILKNGKVIGTRGIIREITKRKKGLKDDKNG